MRDAETIRRPARAICQKSRQSYRSVSSKLSAGGAGPTGIPDNLSRSNYPTLTPPGYRSADSNVRYFAAVHFQSSCDSRRNISFRSFLPGEVGALAAGVSFDFTSRSPLSLFFFSSCTIKYKAVSAGIIHHESVTTKLRYDGLGDAIRKYNVVVKRDLMHTTCV